MKKFGIWANLGAASSATLLCGLYAAGSWDSLVGPADDPRSREAKAAAWLAVISAYFLFYFVLRGVRELGKPLPERLYQALTGFLLSAGSLWVLIRVLGSELRFEGAADALWVLVPAAVAVGAGVYTVKRVRELAGRPRTEPKTD